MTKSGQAVPLAVAGVHTHTRFGDSVLIVGDLGVNRDILESTVVLD